MIYTLETLFSHKYQISQLIFLMFNIRMKPTLPVEANEN